jgi:Sec-independent protein secretion pathway component TatC
MCVLYEAGLFFARFVAVRRDAETAEPAETR